jgi:hypothetical protein
MSKHTLFLCFLSLLSLAPSLYDPQPQPMPVTATQLMLPLACPVTLYSDAMLQPTRAWPHG